MFGREAYQLFNRRMNFKMFYWLLDELKTIKDKKFVVVGDTCSIHKSNHTQQVARRLNIKIVFNVPETLALNPIELYFSSLKANYRKIRLE